MIQRFSEGDFAGVITVTRGEDVTKGGLNFFDEQFCLKRLVEKPSPEQLEQLRRDGWLKPGAPAWYNAGIYIFRPSLFDFTARLQKSPRGEYELTDAISAMVAAGQAGRVWKSRAAGWTCVTRKRWRGWKRKTSNL